jgi:cell division protein FtsL
MSNEKQPIQEGLFGAAKKFSDAFFDGLKNNAAERVLAKAKEQGVPKEVTNIMSKIQQDKKELDTLLQRIQKL